MYILPIVGTGYALNESEFEGNLPNQSLFGHVSTVKFVMGLCVNKCSNSLPNSYVISTKGHNGLPLSFYSRDVHGTSVAEVPALASTLTQELKISVVYVSRACTLNAYIR